MEFRDRGVDGHRVTASPLLYRFQHDVVTPGSTTPLLLTKPSRDLLVRNTVLIRARRAQGIEIASRSAHYGYIVIEFPLFPGFDAAQMITFGLQILLGSGDFVLDENAY